MNLFSGKLKRRDFLIKSLISGMVLSVYFGLLGISIQALLSNLTLLLLILFVSFIVFIVFEIYSISLYIRRLRDLGKPGWWTLISIIPVINIVFFAYLILKVKNKKLSKNDIIIGPAVVIILLIIQVFSIRNAFNRLETQNNFGSSVKGESFPGIFRAAYLAGCKKNTTNYELCECSLQYFEDNYSFTEFQSQIKLNKDVISIAGVDFCRTEH